MSIMITGCGALNSANTPECNCSCGSDKDWCPTSPTIVSKSINICKHCGSWHGPFEVCPITIAKEPETKDDKSLEELYDELGKLKWLGSDRGWDLAIEAVRARIKEMLGK